MPITTIRGNWPNLQPMKIEDVPKPIKKRKPPPNATNIQRGLSAREHMHRIFMHRAARDLPGITIQEVGEKIGLKPSSVRHHIKLMPQVRLLGTKVAAGCDQKLWGYVSAS